MLGSLSCPVLLVLWSHAGAGFVSRHVAHHAGVLVQMSGTNHGLVMSWGARLLNSIACLAVRCRSLTARGTLNSAKREEGERKLGLTLETVYRPTVGGYYDINLALHCQGTPHGQPLVPVHHPCTCQPRPRCLVICWCRKAAKLETAGWREPAAGEPGPERLDGEPPSWKQPLELV